MGVRFSKSIKIGDLFRVNLSKSGISASIGPKGASINVGKTGTYLNLSPSIAGIKSTGVSYRKKLTGGYSNIASKLTNSKQTKTDKNKKVEENKSNDIDVLSSIDNVLDKQTFNEKLKQLDNVASQSIYQLLINGDEDTIENSIGAFLNQLDLGFDVKANYELEENVLYVDLDLPEIETLNINKKEYEGVVLDLSIYLCANFFNTSSYIDKVVISGFTSRRNSDGDLKDEYIYSIKYTRDIFEKTDLSKVNDPYKFLLQFENRINMSSTYTFKSIKPFEANSVTNTKNELSDVKDALKQLGYKQNTIEKIIPELLNSNLTNTSEYLKLALKLLANNKN